MNVPNRLYKYESFNTYSLSNLKNQQVYFSKPVSFNDPFDCAIGCTFEDISVKELDEIHQLYLEKSPNKTEFIRKFGDKPNKYFSGFMKGAVQEMFIESRDNILNNRGVTCFSETPQDILMWSHYSDKHKGFCLEFDTQYEPFNKSIKVEYSKNIPHVNPAEMILRSDVKQIIKMVVTKFESWSYEKEWRSIHNEGNILFGYPAESITGIYFGSKVDYAHLEIIALIIQGQNPNVKLYQGTMLEQQYGVNFTEVTYTPYVKANEQKMV